ncbi:MAG: glycosyltransferase [Planctomycetia bacterium]|nr:glycosyltransferase [Planctomycetia bacterium]
MKQQKIQVALCITELEMGGAEKMLVELASKLDPERFHPVIYSLRSESFHQKASFIPFIRQKNLELRFLDIRSGRNLLGVLFRFRQMLKDQKADVLQCFMFHANLVGRLAGKMAKVPLICSGIRVAERDKKWHLVLDRWSQFLVDQYICVSQTVADFTKKEGKIKSSKIISIPNGISFARDEKQQIDDCLTTFDGSEVDFRQLFDNRRIVDSGTILTNTKWKTSEIESGQKLKPLFSAQSSDRNIVFAGRLTKQKGLDWLLETTPRWLKSMNNWHLWIVGEGEERAKLEDQSQSLQLSEQIHFAGWRPDISEILSQADLFILPSRWEGMPNVLLEAMVHQLPVLSSQAEGVLEILGDNLFASQTVPFGQSDELVQKILFFINNEAIRQELGLKNYNRVINHFSIDKMVSRYESLWIELLSRNRR